MKILHSADWHLDAPLSGHSPQQREYLRRELSRVPQKVAALCKAQQCQMLLLAGDLFDGEASRETVSAVQKVLGELGIPVFISPGNHDFVGEKSPYSLPGWPENVHIFGGAAIQSVADLDCRIYGAGYEKMDCPGLLQGFQAVGEESWHIGLFHGEAEVPNSDYCPITRQQIIDSGLHYLALGHIHKGSSLRVGKTLCAWPGCPMGRGYDEVGSKGVILLTLDREVQAQFLTLDTPRFYDQEAEAGVDPREAVAQQLPALPTEDFYRITLTGYSTGVDTAALEAAFPHIPNLTVRDETHPELDLWQSVGEDTLEGVYFELLQKQSQSESETLSRRARMAARISRQILDGQEVKLL